MIRSSMAEEERQVVVDSVLSNNDENTKFNSTNVNNSDLIEVDVGNLLAVNENKPEAGWSEKIEEHIQLSTRDATQVLFNAIWTLPVDKSEGNFLVKLPDSSTWLPREKPVPKAKPLTKWQQYAKAKGILKKKKSRMIWDDASKSYKPRFGYNRANDDTKDWVIEVPSNADPNEDQFAKRKEAKRERIAKNELQRLRNIARAKKSKVPGVGLTPTAKPDKDQLSKALAIAHKSTASIGKFTENLPKEKPHKSSGKKRKFEPLIGDLKNEREKQMDILKTISNKIPKINVTKAANMALRKEEEDRAREKANNKPFKKGGKGGGKGKGGKGGKGRGGKDFGQGILKGKTKGKKRK